MNCDKKWMPLYAVTDRRGNQLLEHLMGTDVRFVDTDDYADIGFDYLVTLTDDMAKVDHSDNIWIYYFNDTMQIKNWPLEGLVVEKKVQSTDQADLARLYKFRVSILKDDGTVNTDYNEKNGDDQFENGVVEFELKNGENKMFWGFTKGTKYKVEEIDNGGLATTVSYKIFDEEGSVTETKTDPGTTHSGELTQDNEAVLFTNTKTRRTILYICCSYYRISYHTDTLHDRVNSLRTLNWVCHPLQQDTSLELDEIRLVFLYVFSEIISRMFPCETIRIITVR